MESGQQVHRFNRQERQIMDLSERERAALEQFEMIIKQGRSESEAEELLARLIERDLIKKVIEYRQSIIEQRRSITKKIALCDPEDLPEPWYRGPSEFDIFWPSLKQLLESDPGWAAAVPSLDDSSTDIVGLLSDPHSEVIRTRGLVLGHVQSGKTANFTATIAKAADAGYRLFIILSGVHNSLRRQTQLRIDRHLVSLQPTRWLPLTDAERDFGNPVRALPLLTQPNLRLIAVVKKNVTRLTRLRDWLYEAHKHGGLDTCPILVIDDEADQASPNAAPDAQLDRTRINERIVELLSLPRVAYVGYTATPFANVLINPSDARDLYPRTFVYALPKPDSYFGSRELFGKRVSEDEETEADAPHDMIRVVPDDEADRHSVTRLLAEGPEVTPALAQAIDWFVLATAARRVRSGRIQHSSMLIHTTMRVTPQLEYLEPIRAYVKQLGTALASGDSDRLRTLWEAEITREPASRHGLVAVSFDDLAPVLSDVIDDVKVLADNGQSTDRLVYGDEPATVIAVGGNTLSRGLTLEGLVSSYFLRSANQYDSLLQMGRWFGYRPGYSDLPRIWTTRQLANDFEFLADVEDALRREIARYRTRDDATPLKLPVRILLHPRMHATSTARLQFAVRGEATYSGQRPQTTYFAHRDTATIDNNLRAARSLLEAALDAGAREEAYENKVVLRDLPVDMIRRFISEYSFHTNSELRSDLLLNYINRQVAAGSLTSWNVVVMGRRPPGKAIQLGLSAQTLLISRSKLSSSSTETMANIGTLMSKPDRVADLLPAADVKPSTTDKELQDLRDDDGHGLLLLYPIDKDSQPKPGAKKYREALDAAGHLIGVAFSFPTADPRTEPEETIQVDPLLLSRAEMEEMEELATAYVDEEGSRDEIDLGHE